MERGDVRQGGKKREEVLAELERRTLSGEGSLDANLGQCRRGTQIPSVAIAIDTVSSE